MSACDETIVRMIELLNPKSQRRRTLLVRPEDSTDSPLKRKLSSSDSLPDTPDKVNRSENSLDVSWISSPREARRMRNELMEARNHITDLEHRIQQMHGVRKELEIMFDNENKSFKFQHEQDVKKIEQLENQMQAIRRRERDAKDQLEEALNKYRLMKLNYESQIENLEFEINELKTQLDVYETEENEQVSRIQTDKEEISDLCRKTEDERNYYHDLSEDLKSRIARLNELTTDVEVKEQQLQAANQKIKSLEYTIESYGEWQIQSKIQQQKIVQFPELEKEVLKLREDVKNLRDEVQNKLILEEQVHDLNTRLEHYREQDKLLSSLQISNAQLEQVVNEWQTMARAIVDTPCGNSSLPLKMKQVIDRLQNQEITLTSEKVQLDSQVRQMEQEIKALTSETERHQKLNSDLKTIQQQQQALVHRLQKKLQLVSRERDSYRMQLDSYEKDLTMFVAPEQHNPVQTQMSAQKERIENLEKCLDGYKELISNLEGQLHDNQPQMNAGNVVPARSEQTARLQSEIEKLTNENNRLTARCDELEIRLEEELVGRDKVEGKVLHFKMNPASELIAKSEMNIEKLQEENDRLKRKIRKMEEGLESTRLSETICSSREVQALKEEKQTLEVKMQKLKDCFKRSTNEFREACYMLFGYKIDRESSATYKLSSMYADSPTDFLQFSLNSEGNLNMIETQFSATLEDLIDLHLRQQGSVPTFLSAITMDLFNRTTMAAKTFME